MAEPTTVDHELLSELRKINKQLTELNETGKKSTKRGDRTLNKLSDLVRVSVAVELGFALALAVGAIAMHKATAPSNSGLNYPDFGGEVAEGEAIAGYPVTSGFGMRDHPIHGTEKMHKGVDVATPVGTTLYMIGDRGSVECLSDPGGYGTYAVIKPSIGGADFEFLAGHLSNCAPGQYVAGQVFAATGNSGGSTGPHLHWEQHKDGQAIAPQRGFLQWALSGEKPVINAGDTAQLGFGSVSDRLMQAIIHQESGGDHSQVNVDSGAAGGYQIMPENIPSWSKQCLGQEISLEQFMADPSRQDAIASCKLTEYWQQAKSKGESDYEACRSVAASWYSGDASLKNSTAPQGNYPSIYDYSNKVCGGFK